MQKRPTAPKLERETVQVALRLAPSEAETMRRLIERAERLAHVPPGTLTMAAYSRAAVLDYMGRQLEQMEAEPEEAPRGLSVWERVRRAREFFPDPPGPSKKGGKQ
jgi:hypothetical protein